jgi:hypothetical protein
MIIGTDSQLALELARQRGAELRAAAERDRLGRRARGPANRHGPQKAGERRRWTGWAWLGRLTGARTAAR